jgi:hypothetical protein
MYLLLILSKSITKIFASNMLRNERDEKIYEIRKIIMKKTCDDTTPYT